MTLRVRECACEEVEGEETLVRLRCLRFLYEPAVITGWAPEHGLAQRLVFSDADGLLAGPTDDAGSRWFR